MDELIRAAPVAIGTYLLGRFAGAFVVTVVVFCGALAGMAVGTRMWWIDPAVVGSFRYDAYLSALAIIALPNLFFAGALFFTTASVTRSMMATYVVLIALARRPFRQLRGGRSGDALARRPDRSDRPLRGRRCHPLLDRGRARHAAHSIHRHPGAESSGVRRDRCGAAGAIDRALSPPDARGPRAARRRSRSKIGDDRSHAPGPGCVLRRRRHLGAIHVVHTARDARHPAQLDVPGPACAGGGWVHSHLGEPRRKLRHAAAADDAYRRQCADAGFLFVAAGPGGPVQHRDRMARAAGRHRRDRRRDTGAELCLSGREARGGHADGARHSRRGNGRRDRLSARQRRHPHRFPLLPCQFVRSARPADGDDRRPGDLRAGAGEPEICRPSWSS